MELINRFVKDQEGADATEYALMLGLIALVIIGAVTTLGTHIGNLFGSMNNKLAAVSGS
jgi:pilus assembly protein Flp/PilA